MIIALSKMERDGYIILPPAQKTRSVRFYPVEHTERTALQDDIIVPAGQLGPLNIQIVKQEQQSLCYTT